MRLANKVAIVHLQSNELDQALLVLKGMESEIATLPPAEQQVVASPWPIAAATPAPAPRARAPRPQQPPSAG